MKLIIGGAYQGKLAYAKETYRIMDGWIDGRTCKLEEIETCRGINCFHEYVKRLLQQDEGEYRLCSEHLLSLEEEASAFVERLTQKNPEILIVSNELGYGIVPMEKNERLWREAVGRICTCLAAEAQEVVRVVCGVGMILKKKQR